MNDRTLFSTQRIIDLRSAVEDLSFLLSRGYSKQTALKLVGDRYVLTSRQRQAVSQSACSDNALLHRVNKQIVEVDELNKHQLSIDGFNCLITMETAISGGLVIRGRDGAHRDLASVHGAYRKMAGTYPSIVAIGELLQGLPSLQVTWFFDRPVSNSGRLARLVERIAQERHWPWQVTLCKNPDRKLVDTEGVSASSDSWVLDNCHRWVDLPGFVIQQTSSTRRVWRVDFQKAVS